MYAHFALVLKFILHFFAFGRLFVCLFVVDLFQIVFSVINSTASSGLNSIAAVTLQDIVKRVHPDLSDAWATKISKIIGIYS